MAKVDAVRGLKSEKEIKKIFLRNAKIENINGSLQIKSKIKDIICLDLDINIQESRKIQFEDYVLYNVYFDVTFNVFMEDINGETRFENFKIYGLVNKESYLNDREYMLDIIDGVFNFNENKLMYSLVVLLYSEE